MASEGKLDDLNLSSDEVERLAKALKDEEFRKLFVEYAKEIQDPDNRKLYEEEIKQMERDQGMNVKFVHPSPGYVIKTSDDTTGKKVFINICSNEHIDKPTSQPASSGKRGLNWQIPHSFSPAREDIDKAKSKCNVYDVVFHPDTYRMGESNRRFRNIINETAIDGIEKQFNVKLNKNKLKFPSLKFKGIPQATVIRTKVKDGEKTPDELGIPHPNIAKKPHEKETVKDPDNAQMKSKCTNNNKIEELKTSIVAPKYSIVHRSDVDLQQYRDAPDAHPSTRPNELVVHIELPLVKSASAAKLDIFENQLLLECESHGYKLDLKLPYPVDEDNGKAKFDKSKRVLSVTLPVKPATPMSLPSFGTQPIEVLSEQADTGVTQPNDSTSPAKGPGENAQIHVDTNSPAHQLYSLPDYEYHQDQETVSFILNVEMISEPSLTKAWESSPAKYHIKFKSLASDTAPVHYSFCMCFPAPYRLATENCIVDVHEKNAVVVLAKDARCRKLWDRFYIGLNEASLEEKIFPTLSTLKSDLSKLEREATEREGLMSCNTTTSVEVTSMTEEKLTLELKPKSSDSSSDTSLADVNQHMNDTKEVQSDSNSEIEVIKKDGPPIQSILKRTVSESSDDLSASYGHSSVLHHSNKSERDSITGSDDNEMHSDDCKVKRSVSFDEHCDTITYKQGAAVTSFHQTVKNKKRRNRKKEQKRQRHTSTGSEYSSSGDERQKSDKIVVDQCHDKTNHTVNTSKYDAVMVECGSPVRSPRNEEVLEVVKSPLLSLGSIVEQPTEETNDTNNKVDAIFDEDTNTHGSSKLIEVIKQDNNSQSRATGSDAMTNDVVDSDDDTKNGDQDPVNGDQYIKDSDAPETCLSWEDGPVLENTCPVDFTNSLVFDLDDC